MKKLILGFLLFFQLGCVYAQDVESKIPMGLYIHTGSILNNNSGAYLLLQSKLQTFISKEGYSNLGSQNNPLVLAARINQIETRVVETGLRNQIVNVFEFNFIIANTETKTVYSSISLVKSGMGQTTELSMKRAIGEINVISPEILSFISEGRLKINDYYNEFCQDLILQSLNHSKSMQFEDSFATLLSIPIGTKCYEEAQKELGKVYLEYVNYKCANEIIKAKAHLAQNNYEEGLSVLARIYGAKDCQEDIIGVLKDTESEIDEQTKKTWTYLFEQQNNNYQLEQSRINASKEVMVAYYANRPPVYNYNVWLW